MLHKRTSELAVPMGQEFSSGLAGYLAGAGFEVAVVEAGVELKGELNSQTGCWQEASVPRPVRMPEYCHNVVAGFPKREQP